MIKLVWRAVRCCCQPNKVLGFILISEKATEILIDDSGKVIRLFIKPMVSLCKTGFDVDEVPFLENEIRREEELAIYSDDHPIEFWRQQKDFIEAKERR